MTFQDYKHEVREGLDRTTARLKDGDSIDIETAFHQWVSVAQHMRQHKKTIYIIGNGASAAFASHTSVDLWKNIGIKSFVFNDAASLTAVSNDRCYEDVFSTAIEHFAEQGDMVLAISSSGNSENIVRACRSALMREAFLVTLSSFQPDNRIRSLGHLNFYVPTQAYGYAESCHQVLLHYWIDRLSEYHKENNEHHGISTIDFNSILA